MDKFFTIVPLPDLVAFVWLIAWWVGYTLVADRLAWDRREMAKVMHAHRVRWMERMLERDNRMADVSIVVAHIRSGALLASTSILILAGIVAILGNVDRVRTIISELSFAAPAAPELTELKVFVLLGIFIYAFFKFAWCLRQFNYSLVLIGAAPLSDRCDEREGQDYAARAGRVVTRAAGTFNRGLRAYYFGLGTLVWFIQPGIYMVVVVWVVIVLYRRDYRSETLGALADDGDSARDRRRK